MTTEAGLPRYPIESVGNALIVLDMLRSNGRLKVTEVAEALGIARSTAHRMLSILQSYGFAIADENMGFAMGPTLMRLGASALAEQVVRRAARPIIRALARATGETCELAILDGTSVLLVDIAEGTQTLRVVDELGERAPAHLTAAGKAMLAGFSHQRVDDLYANHVFEVVTPRSISSRRALDDQLRQVRRDGYASARMELGSEYVGVAAAIRPQGDAQPAAITIALPTLRAEDDFASKLGPIVAEAADEIAVRLVGSSTETG